MLKIQCNSCKYENKLQYSPEVGGKRIMFKCKNKDCNEFITIRLPKSAKVESTTIIVEKQQTNLTKAYLEWDRKGEILRFPLNKGIQVIGRASNHKYPDISLESSDSSISRLHCLIEGIESKSETHYIIKDHNSKNGVLLNGVQIYSEDELYLVQGDEIQLGLTKLKFRYA